MVRVPNLPATPSISADDLVVLYDNNGDITGKATLTAAVTAGASGLIGSGDMILSAAQTVTGAKQFNPGTLLDKGNLVYNVKAYLAVGDGSTDDTTAIQQAIDAAHAAGGGTVSFPAGTYKITAELTLYSDVTLQGVSMESSIIKQVTLDADGIRGDALSSLCIRDLAIVGNGSGSTAGTGTGIGIHLTYGGAGNNPFHNFRKVMVRNWGGDGLRIQTPIVCTFDGIYSAFNGGDGFDWYEGGTSCTFTGCWARQNAQAGYRFFESVYQSLTGCASDNNGVSYWIEDAQSIGFYSCGSEGALMNGGDYDGYGWYIDNSSNITINGWVTDNRNIGIWVTNSAQAISINAADNTPNGTAVNFTKVDSGCNATIYELHNTTANSLATGTTSTINDGAGGIRGVDVFVLSATASTVPVFNANKALISSAVTPTELGYLSGVTSAIQTQLGTKQNTVSFGAGVETFLATPSSANLATAVTGETGSGALVFGTSPSFTTSIAVGNLTVTSVTGGATITGSAGGAFNVTDQVYTGAVEFSGDLLPDANGTRSLGSTALRLNKGWFANLEVTNAPTLNGVAIPSISSTDTLTNKTLTAPQLQAPQITGASGTLSITAASDGGDYNIFSANGAQTLAVYGSAGNSLSLSLLDGNLTVAAGQLIKATSSPPASAAATGTTGQIEWDSGFVYVCTATNTWKRVAIATW